MLCFVKLAVGFWLGALALFGQRIISLAPSLTETVCEVGLCDKLVGVTDYCLFPPSVKRLPKVGGYLDPNLELVVGLQPDWVLVLPEHRDTTGRLKALGLKVEEFKNYSLDDIYLSLERIGGMGGAASVALARKKVAELKKRVEMLRVKRAKAPRCLLVLGHEPGASALKEVFVVGNQGFLNELLKIVGGTNVYQEPKPYFPKLSQEALLALDPDLILDLVPEEVVPVEERKSREAMWRTVAHLRAIREGRYVLIHGTAVLQASPRFIHTLEEMRKALDGL